MNPNFKSNPGLPVPPYYPTMQNSEYMNIISSTSSPESGFYSPQQNPNNYHLSSSPLSSGPYCNYPTYQQHPHPHPTQFQQQPVLNNFSLYQNPAINFQPSNPDCYSHNPRTNSIGPDKNEAISSAPQTESDRISGGPKTRIPGLNPSPKLSNSISINKEGTTREVKVFLGRVTSVEDDTGVIGQETFFHISALVGGIETPKEGDKVLVNAVASRTSRYKWKAKQFQLVKIDLDSETVHVELPPVTSSENSKTCVESASFSCTERTPSAKRPRAPPPPKISGTRTDSPSYSKSVRSNTGNRKSGSDIRRDRSRSRREVREQIRKSNTKSKPREPSRKRDYEKSHKHSTENAKSSDPKKKKLSVVRRKYSADSSVSARIESIFGENVEADSRGIAQTTRRESIRPPNLYSKETTPKIIQPICHEGEINETSAISLDHVEKSSGNPPNQQNSKSFTDSINDQGGTQNPGAIDNTEQIVFPNPLPSQIPVILDNTETVNANRNQSSVDAEENFPADRSTNPLIRMKSEKIHLIVNNLDQIPTTTSSPSVLHKNLKTIQREEITKIKTEPPEEVSTPLDENSSTNDFSLNEIRPTTIGQSLATLQENTNDSSKNIDKVLISNSSSFSVDITKIKVEPPEKVSTELNQVSPANNSNKSETTPTGTGSLPPSLLAEEAVKDSSEHIEKVSPILLNNLTTPADITKIKERNPDCIRSNETTVRNAEQPRANNSINNLTTSDSLTSPSNYLHLDSSNAESETECYLTEGNQLEEGELTDCEDKSPEIYYKMVSPDYVSNFADFEQQVQMNYDEDELKRIGRLIRFQPELVSKPGPLRSRIRTREIPIKNSNSTDSPQKSESSNRSRSSTSTRNRRSAREDSNGRSENRSDLERSRKRSVGSSERPETPRKIVRIDGGGSRDASRNGPPTSEERFTPPPGNVSSFRIGVCEVCGKYHKSKCWYRIGGPKFNVHVQLKSKDTSSCSRRTSQDKCENCEKYGHQENVCRFPPKERSLP